MELNGYLYEEDQRKNASNGMWCPAEKDNERYFLKQFRAPRAPRKGCAPSIFVEKTRECREWFEYRKSLIDRLRELGDGRGNIVIPQELFEHNGCYYQTTFWIDITTDSLEEVKNYTEREKVMLLKTYAAALKKVHSKGIVHGDLKIDNVLIGRSSTNQPVSKLIDFDDSYFACRPLRPDLIVATDAYWSPELAAYKCGHTEYAEKLTCASDVFTTAIVFHQFWTGKMPSFKTEMLYQTIAAGKDVVLDPSLPLWLHNLLMAMLEQDPEERPTMEDVHTAIVQERYDVTESLQSLVDLSVQRMNLYSAEDQTKLRKAVSKARRQLMNPVYEKVNAAASELYNLLTSLSEAKVEPKKEPPKSTEKPQRPMDSLRGIAKIPQQLQDLLDLPEMQDWYLNFFTDESHKNLDQIKKLAARGGQSLSGEVFAGECCETITDTLGKLVSKHGFAPAIPLPDGYIRVELISEAKVRAVRESNIAMTFPVSTAVRMNLLETR